MGGSVRQEGVSLQKAGRGTWKSGDLEVNVNPELWIEVDGQPHAIKLYFRSEGLSQANNLALEVIQKTVGKSQQAGILDLQQGKLFVRTTEPPDGIDLLLDSEATGFALLWSSLA